MNILVVGSGGREHALCWAFKQSSITRKFFCANGNAGIGEIAECVAIKPEDICALAKFAEENRVDLTFVGGETALALGIADEFESRGLKIIGASQKAARLESSKAFAKDFMARHNIPTAHYKVADSAERALEILRAEAFGDEDAPVVIKADGLAAGKGVIVAKNRAEAIEAVNAIVSGEIVKQEAATKIVLEECLTGMEVSFLLFSDGKNFALMPPARDHKRIGEEDSGPNTGGMGTICDDDLLSPDETREIVEKIIKPTLEGAQKEGFPFRGVLFLGLMLTEGGAKVLEYNVRFGDPETQAILVRLEMDLTEICQAILSQTLDELPIKWRAGSSACIILAAANYPAKPKTGDAVQGLEEANNLESTIVFHSGTAKTESGDFVTTGGRVLGVTARAENLDEALRRSYLAVDKISFEGMQYRRDIGK